MHIGIDLGTTFCCVAYIHEGSPQVIPDNRGRMITPSVIWFNGKTAYIGEEANKKKITAYDPIFEFFKRDMGKPTEDLPGKAEKAPYQVEGIKYGAVGMSAILLRKLKRDAWQYFKKNKLIDDAVKEIDFKVDAIITVPAYFGDEERQATRSAGELAGLTVAGIVNEPTAASLTFGISVNENKKIMVFDLGGGTFDVTILEIVNGDFNKVLATDGNIQLGGKDWDELIINHLKDQFKKASGFEIADERFYDIQQLAIQAKKDLSDNEETTVYLSENGVDAEIPLHRSAPEGDNSMSIDMDENAAASFFFNERATELLSACSMRCLKVLEQSGLTWHDIDEIVLAGGSCRMPMIPEMLEKLSGKKIKKHREGFSYDTAIAIGAAIYGQSKGRIEDVTPKSIGIKLMNGKNQFYIDHLIYKNTALPTSAKKKYDTDPYAVLEIYEGESKDPVECDFRGRLELENTGPSASIFVEVDENGILKILADYQPEGIKETRISGSGVSVDYLSEKIQSITIIS